MKNEFGESLGEQFLQLLDYINQSSGQLKSLVKGLLDYAIKPSNITENKSEVVVKDFMAEISVLLQREEQHNIRFFGLEEIYVNEVILKQILINLLTNALKYNDKELPEVTVNFKEKATHYFISVMDNGPGISEDKVDTIFDAFTTLKPTDRFGNKGHGLGLAIVKKLVNEMGEL